MTSRSFFRLAPAFIATGAYLLVINPAASHDTFSNGVEVSGDDHIALVEVHANIVAGDGIRQKFAPVGLSSVHSYSITPYNGPIEVFGSCNLEFGGEGPPAQIWSLDSTDGAPRSGNRTLGWPTRVPEGATLIEASTNTATVFASDRHFAVGADIAAN
jgi:hypothetical protein